MTSLKIAHIREQGQDMIIAPLAGSFEHKSAAEQSAAVNEIQVAARSAGLRGNVVVFWPSGGGELSLSDLGLGIHSCGL